MMHLSNPRSTPQPTPSTKRRRALALSVGLAALTVALCSAPVTDACSFKLVTLTERLDEAERDLARDGSSLDPFQIDLLREHGSDAVDELHARLAATGRLDTADPTDDDTATDPAALALLDRVCGQHDCASSRLFWHTDLDSAVEQAEAEGKPILSLRLLGRLDEELSCANSRYFRTLYYADPEIADLLRSEFVLHWRSMRPVPKVTVELADGRTLRRTLTGNSIHYVLDFRGRLVDGLPGLYAPERFRRSITKLGQEARAVADLDDEAFIVRRSQRAGRLAQQIERDRESDLRRLAALAAPQPALQPAVLADLRDRRTMSKAATVNPVLDALFPSSRPPGPWNRLAYRFQNEARLSERTGRRVERLQDLGSVLGAEIDSPLARERVEGLIRTLESDLAADTALNHYYLRPVLLLGIATGGVLRPDEGFDRWVYEQVFADPGDDPWLGLAPATAFAALRGGGRDG